MKTIILAALLLIGIFAFWFGLKMTLKTEFPLLAVASGSMEPTLYKGDLIIVQGGLNFAELKVGPYKLKNNTLNPNPGEIIVYYDPRENKNPNHLIVHRAIDKYEKNGTWFFFTRGDANSGPYDPWSPVRQDFIVGKVVAKVPWFGYIPLFMRTPVGLFVVISLFAILIIIDFIFPSKKTQTQRKGK
jgi:signal peptidase